MSLLDDFPLGSVVICETGQMFYSSSRARATWEIGKVVAHLDENGSSAVLVRFADGTQRAYDPKWLTRPRGGRTRKGE